ncbi:marine proteobacterial sortase target protein [Corallincola platygyrae]|uniref:Marine proteobacterial sortase target protein n=1 Tax=Corallincola platygyrae TaxID=1193278 RepID=A0ABW4XH76_9GAMM
MGRHAIPPHQQIMDRPLALKERQRNVGTPLFGRQAPAGGGRLMRMLKRLLGSLCLIALGTWLLLTLGTAQAREFNSRGEQEDAAPQLMLKQGGVLTEAMMLDSRLHLDINGMVVRGTLTQTFSNQTDDWLDGVYLLPLPDDAAVNRLRMVIGERIIEGEIKEKKEAKKIFEQAKKSGKRATLLTQRRPNMFTNEVANLPPGEKIVVEVTYLQTVSYRDGAFSLRFPMTITPRFSPGVPLADLPEEEAEQHISFSDTFANTMSWALPTDEVPDAPAISPFMFSVSDAANKVLNPITITASINPGMSLEGVSSGSHQLVVNQAEGKYQIKLTAPQVAMDRDFLLNWRPALGKSPQAAMFTEQVDGDSYGLLMLIPPANPKAKPGAEESVDAAKSLDQLTLPKEMIFIIDTSGSMGGEPIRQAKASLVQALSWLSPKDSFNIIRFSSSASQLFPSAMPADASSIAHAKRYVDNLSANGGTNMMSALKMALPDPEQKALTDRVRQIVFITDGAVGNEQALFKYIHHGLGDSRLFTVGIGAAPNSYFMRRAAEFGRGTFTFINNTQAVQGPMSDLFKRLSSPVADDIKIEMADGSAIEFYPSRIPALYLGEPLLIAFKPDQLAGDMVISGKTSGKDWRRTIALQSLAQSEGVGSLWGRAKIKSLMDEKTAGADADEIRSQVLSVALAHQLTSAYTSFVAVEKTPVRPLNEVSKKVPVPNLHPQGTAEQSYAVPNTATGAELKLAVGSALFMVALLLMVLANRRVLTQNNGEFDAGLVGGRHVV